MDFSVKHPYKTIEAFSHPYLRFRVFQHLGITKKHVN